MSTAVLTAVLKMQQTKADGHDTTDRAMLITIQEAY